MATPMRTLIDDLCGGPKDGVPLKAIVPGGSSTPMMPVGVAMECTLDYESIADAGSLLGAGAVTAINEQACIVRLTERLAAFYAHESCGKCIPCREGTDWMYKIVRRIEHGQGRMADLDLLLDICDNITGKSFCPLGDAAVGPVQSSIQHFRAEYEYHVDHKTCMPPARPRTSGSGPSSAARSGGFSRSPVAPDDTKTTGAGTKTTGAGEAAP
jgi:NADH-quinone oxidoreductase subunit F